jgi:nitroreductase
VSANPNPRASALTAARTAGFAPSIHNTQPWLWRVGERTLHLRAVRSRQLALTDPNGRMLAVSCGAALHHALTALTAQAWATEVRRTPDPDDPDLLAVIDLAAQIELEPTAVRDLQLLSVRRTDRRPVVDSPVPSQDLDQVAQVAADHGARLHLLRHDDVIELAAAADKAQQAESMDAGWRDELSYWVGAGRPSQLGVPEEVIPAVPPQTTVPGRDFGRAGTLPVGSGHDVAAKYALLYADDDTPSSWLRAGEALSALWIRALRFGLTVLPLSAAAEVPATRQTLRRMLGSTGEPLLVLRIGVGDDQSHWPEHTPRLPAEQTVEPLT